MSDTDGYLFVTASGMILMTYWSCDHNSYRQDCQIVPGGGEWIQNRAQERDGRGWRRSTTTTEQSRRHYDHNDHNDHKLRWDCGYKWEFEWKCMKWILLAYIKLYICISIHFDIQLCNSYEFCQFFYSNALFFSLCGTHVMNEDIIIMRGAQYLSALLFWEIYDVVWWWWFGVSDGVLYSEYLEDAEKHEDQCLQWW